MFQDDGRHDGRTEKGQKHEILDKVRVSETWRGHVERTLTHRNGRTVGAVRGHGTGCFEMVREAEDAALENSRVDDSREETGARDSG